MTVKDLILNKLSYGEEISGEALALEAGVSRAAVWKAIKRLRSEGYLIEATQGHGYRLKNDNRLCEGRIRSHLKSDLAVKVYDLVGSTNDEAARLASEAPKQDYLIVANEQTAGQGRLGRTFISKSDTGLYMTLLLHPNISAERATAVTVLAAVALKRVIERQTALSPKIKWVNDLLYNGKKFAGILTKGSVDMENGALSYLTVGIGINVLDAPLDPKIKDIATSVEAESGKAIDRNLLAALITDEILGLMPQLGSAEISEEYRESSMIIGEKINVIKPSEIYPAEVIGMDSDCRLLLRLENGQSEILASGDVSIRKRQ